MSTDDATARIEALCETIDAFDETLLSDLTVRLSGRTAKQSLESPAALPVFDSVQQAAQLEIGATLGEGGMGIVRLADQRTLHRSVAVKTIKPSRESWETNQELYREALTAGILEHPNIVPIYALYQNERGAPLIVMKRVEGESWHACIQDPTKIPDLSTTDMLGWHLEVFDEVCRAAHFAHERGILHRDIKPDNVMLGHHGEVYLLDWGIAVTTDDARAKYLLHARNSTGVAGTPSYMAPEMAAAEAERYGPRTDVYLLGATLYHALVGAPPHGGKTLYEILLNAHASRPATFPESVPDELQKIVHRAMAASPEVRYESAEELRRAVAVFREHRASIALSDEAAQHFQTTTDLLADGAARAAVLQAFQRCRFGCEHALTVWSGNDEARALLDQALARMVRFEIESRNLDQAQALCEAMSEVPAELTEAVDALRTELADDEREVAALRSLERRTSVTTGANYRLRGAVAAWVLLTVMPLFGHINAADVQQDMQTFFWHGAAMCVLLCGVLFVARKGLLANQANRNIGGIILVFALSLPLLRYVAWQTDMSFLAAMLTEQAGYTVGYAALGFLSQFSPWFGLAVYAIVTLVGVHFPDLAFIGTSVGNFLAIGYVVHTYRRQRA